MTQRFETWALFYVIEQQSVRKIDLSYDCLSSYYNSLSLLLTIPEALLTLVISLLQIMKIEVHSYFEEW